MLVYDSLSNSVNAAHNGNSVISYYPLSNITDLLARLQKCVIFSSLDPKIRLLPYWPDTGVKAKKLLSPQ